MASMNARTNRYIMGIFNTLQRIKDDMTFQAILIDRFAQERFSITG